MSKPSALEALGVDYPQPAEVVPPIVRGFGPGPDGTPDRRRYPALGFDRRTTIPRGNARRAEDSEPA